MIEIKPPARPPIPADALVMFLAGSIDMGSSRNWQSDLAARVAGIEGFALNPRRDDWDSSWRQSIDDARFREQVEWELDGMDRADLVAMWFERDSQSPITLLELGLTARSRKLMVGCPDGFWRKGNIEVVCARFGVPLFGDSEAFASAVDERLHALARSR